MSLVLNLVLFTTAQPSQAQQFQQSQQSQQSYQAQSMHAEGLMYQSRWKVNAVHVSVKGASDDASPRPVTDLTTVDLSTLKYNNSNIKHEKYKQPPWNTTTTTDAFRAWKSPTVEAHLNKILSLQVAGLKISFAQVFEIMAAGGCIPYVLGGEVRDSLLNLDSLDTDIAFTCQADDVAEIAKANGWEYSHHPGSTYISIGSASHEAGLEGKDADTSLETASTSNEYCVNTIFWDAGNKVMLDPTGFGVQDALHGIARIPGPQSLYGEWLVAPQGKKSYFKALRLWKLRIAPKSFNISEATFYYVVGTLHHAFIDDYEQAADDLKYFIQAYAGRAAQFEEQMKLDLGPEFFALYMGPIFDSVRVEATAASTQSKTPVFTAVKCWSAAGRVCTTVPLLDASDESSSLSESEHIMIVSILVIVTFLAFAVFVQFCRSTSTEKSSSDDFYNRVN